MSRSLSNASSPLNLIGNADQLTGLFSATGSGGVVEADGTTKPPKRSIEELEHLPHGNRNLKEEVRGVYLGLHGIELGKCIRFSSLCTFQVVSANFVIREILSSMCKQLADGTCTYT